MRTQSKRNDFKNRFTQHECKIIKRVLAKLSLLKSAEIFEKPEIEGIKMENTCKILGELGSAKKNSRQPSLKNENFLIYQIGPKEYMKTDFTN